MADLDDWWKKWWEADFTWEGLADKPWHGWIVHDGAPIPDPSFYPEDHENHGERPDGARKANLQDYWAQFYSEDDLIAFTNAAGETRHFTPFHLPMAWQDGSPTGKADWADDALYDVIRAAMERSFSSKFRFVGNPKTPDGRCQFSGGVFREFDLTRLSEQPIKLSEKDKESLLYWHGAYCHFAGNANFHTASFAGNADFNSASFAGYADFESASFAGYAFFGSASFADDADFESASFAGYAFFDSASFAGDVHFWSTSFAVNANFESTSFAGNADFESASFAGNAHFRSTSFAGDADFESASFAGQAIFNRASFAGGAGFKSASFDGYVIFRSVSFAGDANFVSASFAGAANFVIASFDGYAIFTSASFAGAAYFNSAIFCKNAYFLGQNADMVKPAFTHEISLIGQGEEGYSGKVSGKESPSQLANRAMLSAHFKDMICLGDFDFSTRHVLGQSSFDGAMFFRKARFHESRLHSSIGFFNARFRDALKPQECLALPDEAYKRLHKAETRFREIRMEEAVAFEDWKTKFETDRTDQQKKAFRKEGSDSYFENLESCFRVLKQAMENTRHRNMESHFFQLELKARRKRRDEHVTRVERCFSYLFDWTSQYGSDAMRPLVILLSSVVLFAVMYQILGSATLSSEAPYIQWVRTTPVTDFFDALSFSAGRMLGFGALGGELQEGSIMYYRIDPDFENRSAWTNFGIRFLATLQTIIAIILVFLTGLAVRRKFQIN